MNFSIRIMRAWPSGIVNSTRMNEASVRHQYIFFFSIVCRMCFRT